MDEKLPRFIPRKLPRAVPAEHLRKSPYFDSAPAAAALRRERPVDPLAGQVIANHKTRLTEQQRRTRKVA